MTEINSQDYHDYVFKGAKLIAEFDQMYRKSKDVPWLQDKQEDWLDVRLTMDLLKEYAPFDYICDLGCGLGFFLQKLRKEVGRKECETVGFDVSGTCCEKAAKIFPGSKFHVLNLMQGDILESEQERRSAEKFKKRLFSTRATLWYVFPKIENIIKNINRFVSKEEDLLLVSQNFPPLESNFVGKDTIPDPEALLGWFGKYFRPVKTIWQKDNLSKINDNWFIGVFKKI